MPTTAETYRKTYAERHLDRLEANYERAKEEWEREMLVGQADTDREAEWLEEQIKAQHDYVSRLKKAGIVGAADSMDIIKAEEIYLKRVSDDIKNKAAAEKQAQSMFTAPSNIMADLFSISPEIQTALQAAVSDPTGATAMRLIKQHLQSKGVTTTVGTLGDGQRMAAAIAFEQELNNLTGGSLSGPIRDLVSDEFTTAQKLMDPQLLERLKKEEMSRAKAKASQPLANLKADVDALRAQGVDAMDAVRVADPTLVKAEEDLANLVERRDQLDAGMVAPTEEELKARALELTGPMLKSAKARKERRKRVLGGPSDRQKIIASLTARAGKYLDETPDPDEDHSEAGEMAIRLQDMMGSGALASKDLIDRAAEFAGGDMAYRDEIIMRVFAHDLSRTRRKEYRDVPEQVGQGGPEFQITDMAELEASVEEVAPEQ